MVAPLIQIAVALAQYAPALMRHFGVGEDKTAAAEQVVELAQTVTGAATPGDALIALKNNAEMRARFAEKAMDLDAVLEQAYLADVQDARKRDTLLAQAGSKNWRPDIMFGLAVAMIGGLVYVIWRSPDINEYMKGIFTLVLGRFLGYLDNIYNFEFGSTRSNKTKDATISDLSKR